MNNNEEDSLIVWNQLNINNAEQGLVSAMFSSMIATAPIIDRFVTWLLVGTGATAVLLITNISNILPFLSIYGFKVSGLFLVISGVFGLLAKFKSIQCQISYESDNKIKESMKPILEKYENDAGRILEHAQQRNINLETDIDIKRVINKFCEPAPKWVRWRVKRHLRKNEGNRQVGYHLPVRSYFFQRVFAFMQGVTFIIFIFTTVMYASN